MDPKHLHEYIIVPVLDRIDMLSLSASRLLLGTAMIESDLRWVRQLSDGPALGLFQMEPDTHNDIWANWLEFRPDIANVIATLAPAWPKGPAAMVWNVGYAVAMARLTYRRRHEPLPPPDDAVKLARYHKLYYNTFLGATKEVKAVAAMRKAIKWTT